MMSWKVTFSRFCLRKSTRRSKCLASASAMAGYSCPITRTTRAAPTALPSACQSFCADGSSSLGEHCLDLGLERLRVERLDDVVVHAGLLRRDHVLGLRFGGDHDEGRLVQAGIGAHFIMV